MNRKRGSVVLAVIISLIMTASLSSLAIDFDLDVTKFPSDSSALQTAYRWASNHTATSDIGLEWTPFDFDGVTGTGLGFTPYTAGIFIDHPVTGNVVGFMALLNCNGLTEEQIANETEKYLIPWLYRALRIFNNKSTLEDTEKVVTALKLRDFDSVPTSEKGEASYKLKGWQYIAYRDENNSALVIGGFPTSFISR